MRFFTIALFSGFVSLASAHFQLEFPAPRGDFVEDDEPSFCDGYTNAVPNRTLFPLSAGFVVLNSEHPTWSIGVLYSTVQNPNSFDNFTSSGNVSQFAIPFSQQQGENVFCLPIDLQALGVSDFKDGANITLEFAFDGGDGALYQCADLTLSSNATFPTNVSCTNATFTTNAAAGDAARLSSLTAGLFGLLGIAFSL